MIPLRGEVMSKSRTRAMCAAVLAFLCGASPAPVAPASPAGNWTTEGGQSIVKFEPCGQGWCGRIDRILRRDPRASPQDVHNPDPRLRARPILGIRLVELTAADGDRWRGSIYDPRSGKSYKALVRRRSGNQLEVQGCLMVFCQTQRWTGA